VSHVADVEYSELAITSDSLEAIARPTGPVPITLTFSWLIQSEMFLHIIQIHMYMHSWALSLSKIAG
jgi:hypothetical protein